MIVKLFVLCLQPLATFGDMPAGPPVEMARFHTYTQCEEAGKEISRAHPGREKITCQAVDVDTP